MADMYTQVTITPSIPKDLLPEGHLKFLNGYGIRWEDDHGKWYLYADEYSASSFEDVGDDGERVEKEHGEDELVALFQNVIKKSKGELKYVYLHAGCICSKMRPDEFGGWVIFITKKSHHWMGTWDFIEKMKRRFG